MSKLVFFIIALIMSHAMAFAGVNTEKIEITNCNTHYLDIDSIEVYAMEEEVELNFDTKAYLPNNFNPLKGKGDLDWSAIEIYSIEEDVELPFDTKDYLPLDFNPLKGKGNLDWRFIELIELEEDVEIDFDTKKYLPKSFSPNRRVS